MRHVRRVMVRAVVIIFMLMGIVQIIAIINIKKKQFNKEPLPISLILKLHPVVQTNSAVIIKPNALVCFQIVLQMLYRNIILQHKHVLTQTIVKNIYSHVRLIRKQLIVQP